MAHILIVDDEVSITKMVEQLLAIQGHQVVCATNGIEALKILGCQAIDLVITDIVMPEMDGYELIMELRKRPDSPKIIAMSGGAVGQYSTELLHTALLMKADKILLKPFDSVSMNDAIGEVLGGGNPYVI